MSEDLLEKRPRDIRAMFGRIAPRYDLLNRLLSLGSDVRWRRSVVGRTVRSSPRMVLDVCTGTGELAFAFPPSAGVFGSDFSLPMLARARRKADRSGRVLQLFAADTLRLPVKDASFDVVTVAFGIRNFEDLENGLRELARVLRPRGTLLVLEFSRPRGLLAPVLGWWVYNVPPRMGRLVSRDREAYQYLSESVAGFPDTDSVCEILDRVGFGSIATHPLTWGVATIYEAVRRPAGSDHDEEES